MPDYELKINFFPGTTYVTHPLLKNVVVHTITVVGSPRYPIASGTPSAIEYKHNSGSGRLDFDPDSGVVMLGRDVHVVYKAP